MKEKFKVLIVDTDKSKRKVYGEILKRNPELQLEEAGTGKDALRKIERSAPAIVLCDEQIPDMDALSFCRLLKGDPDSYLASIYFIMLSAKNLTKTNYDISTRELMTI